MQSLSRSSQAFRSLPPMDRWWASVECVPDGCWRWLGAPNAGGYGTMKIQGRSYVATRLGYEWLVGPIAEGLQIDHLCRNRLCVRPSHLEPVSSRENTLRGRTLAAAEVRKTHCGATLTAATWDDPYV